MEGEIEYVTMNELHIGNHMVIKDKPCKITELNVSKTGKHGAAKAVVTGKDIFTEKKYSNTYSTSEKVQVPIIKNETYQLNNIDDERYLDLLAESGEQVSHMKLKWDNDVERDLVAAFENGKSLEVRITSSMGEYKVQSFSELK